jgi:hypothetical protein
MYCPNCLKENSPERRFCRYCGMALQIVSKELAEHLATGKPDEPVIKLGDGVTQHRMLTMLLWGGIALVVGMGVIAVGNRNDAIGLLGLLLVLGGALLAFYGVVSHLRTAALPSRRVAKQQPLPRSEPDAAGATKSFPEAMASVTELTTRKLDATLEITHEEGTANTRPTE